MSVESVLITDCTAESLGHALAEAFQTRGMHVFAAARDLSEISHLQTLPQVTVLTLDLTSAPSVQAAVENVQQQTGGKLHYLVNNAGHPIVMPNPDFDIDTAKSMYDINVWGMLHVTQAFSSLVSCAHGTITNISPIAPFHTGNKAFYRGSKAAVTAITDTLRPYYWPSGVKVVTVMTGAVSTWPLIRVVDFEVPNDELYQSMPKYDEGRALRRAKTPGMKPPEFAEKVVAKVLKGANGQIWIGGHTSIIRLMTNWFPASLSTQDRLEGLQCRSSRPKGCPRINW